MTPSSKERRLLLGLLLAADFMVFAGWVGAGIVLREGSAAWVDPALARHLRDHAERPLIALVCLLLSHLPAKGWVYACIPTALVWMVPEACTVALQAWGQAGSGSYTALFLAGYGFVAAHLGGAIWWLRRGGLSSPLFLPFWRFASAAGIVTILALHWPLYS